MLQVAKKRSHEAILLNVDSTVLKLENSNLSTESVQDPAMPNELAMHIQRFNETENETAAFNMGNEVTNNTQ